VHEAPLQRPKSTDFPFEQVIVLKQKSPTPQSCDAVNPSPCHVQASPVFLPEQATKPNNNKPIKKYKYFKICSPLFKWSP